MIRFMPLMMIAALLGGCATDESISKFVDPAADYLLVEMDGAPVAFRATIAFPEQGRVVGQAPCNTYFASQTVHYPWFGLEGIGATRVACSDLAQETLFFKTLEGMTLAETLGATLILSNSIGQQMVFDAR